MSVLAINGGNPVISTPFPLDTTIGVEESEAAARVFKRGSLSGFYGNWGECFLGGDEVQDFERQWSEKFRVKHAVSMNSATSGLYAAMGAIGLSPGDEVIVPPYTMSATVMAPLLYGGIPVFADIDADTFCLDIEAVRAAITPKLKRLLPLIYLGTQRLWLSW